MASYSEQFGDPNSGSSHHDMSSIPDEGKKMEFLMHIIKANSLESLLHQNTSGGNKIEEASNSDKSYSLNW